MENKTLVFDEEGNDLFVVSGKRFTEELTDLCAVFDKGFDRGYEQGEEQGRDDLKNEIQSVVKIFADVFSRNK